MHIVIALDAMGGDHAPIAVVEGALLSLREYPVHYIFYGDEGELLPLISCHPSLLKVSRIVHTTEVISNDEKPTRALRLKDSSMRRAVEAVSMGEANGVVSSGNTGAYMALSKIIFKTIPGIDRPAIATIFPTKIGASVMLDMGANIQCDVEHLVQFALMGNVYAKDVLGIPSPTLGLLNIGSEEMKGGAALQQAAQILKQIPHILNFQGFIEGNDISAGKVDVVVTDGFTGNVAIKTAEGIGRVIFGYLRDHIQQSWRNKIGAFLLSPVLKSMKDKFDPTYFNGAMFIGLNEVAIKSHGSANSIAFANAIGVAHKMISHHFNQQILSDLAKVEEYNFSEIA